MSEKIPYLPNSVLTNGLVVYFAVKWPRGFARPLSGIAGDAKNVKTSKSKQAQIRILLTPPHCLLHDKNAYRSKKIKHPAGKSK